MIAVLRLAWDARLLLVCDGPPRDASDMLSRRIQTLVITFHEHHHLALERAFAVYETQQR